MKWENEPYTFRRTGVSWFGRTYEVSFEETPIRSITGSDYEYVQEMVDLLNTAWNIGYHSGLVAGASLATNLAVKEIAEHATRPIKQTS